MSQRVSTWSSFFGTIGNAFIYILEDSNVSLGSATLLLIVAVALVPSTVSFMKRVMIGAPHVIAHLAAALFFAVLLEAGIVDFVPSKTLQTSGQFSLSSFYMCDIREFHECFLASNIFEVYGNYIFKILYY